MDHSLQIWIIVVSIALIACTVVQIVTIGIFIRVLKLVRPKEGQQSLREIAEKSITAIEALERVTRTLGKMLDDIKRPVEEVATISHRQLSHADRVVGDVLDGVERVNHEVSAILTWPSRQARALSAG